MRRSAMLARLQGSCVTTAAVAFVGGLVAGRLRARRAADPEDLRLSARERAALRRVTTLAAQGASSTEIFDAVAGETGRVVGAENMIVYRVRPDDMLLIVASWNPRGAAGRIVPVGLSFPIPPDGVCAEVIRTGHPAHMIYTPAQLERIYAIAPAARNLDVCSGSACPIVVEGRLWGIFATYFAAARPRREGVEERMLGFLELVAAAIANAVSRAELSASRARVVAAADASRRRIERDLHDGVQQRVVHLALAARIGVAAMPDRESRARLSEMAAGLTDVLGDLREISHGLHPAILSCGGLEPALGVLAERAAVPVKLELDLDRRLAESVEVAVYYVVSEALANAARYARASLVRVDAFVDEALVVTVRDDGVGGADRDRGQGLIGLQDRVEALGGRFEVASPPGCGTTVIARIPIDGSLRTVSADH